jgi:hypothetical protein
VLFGLNDGSIVDDNHDDWVGVMYVTSLPGAVWLFGPALGGRAWMRRRRDGPMLGAAAA